MALELVDKEVARNWEKEYQAGSDKRAPSVDLVRLDKWFFKGKPGKLLEYGFGSGVNMIFLLESGHDIDGIEISPSAIQLVQKKLAARPALAARARLHQLDPSSVKLPFADETFDYVTCISVLSLLGTPDRILALLSEFRRVLKPGGKLITDINTDRSEFARKSRPLGKDVYAYRTRPEADPVLTYCPKYEDDFRALLAPVFTIDDMGYTGYKYMGAEIVEFIACAHKPERD